jgi:hypothetical protein
MGGLELSRDFFLHIALPELEQKFPAVLPRLAAGLVGNGSECFGYDDELSRDHDWGADFYIWVPDDMEEAVGPLEQWKRDLFVRKEDSYPLRRRTEYGANIGAMTVSAFYRAHIGFPQGPETLQQWRQIPEELFALAVNGDVFCDGEGAFTAVRERLRTYYPEDVRLKKIAAKCMVIAQTGQYNLERCMKRGDLIAANEVRARFISASAALVCHLGRVYCPYYKWLFRRMSEQPVLGAPVSELLRELAAYPMLPAELSRQLECVRQVCTLMGEELRRQGLSVADDDFFTGHGECVRSRIQDDYLRGLPTQYE